ncbi:hypothetical protein ABKN59_009477 [Abortiporus biennis]
MSATKIWYTHNLKNANLTLKVKAIHLSATLPPGSSSGSITPIPHWRIYLEVPDQKSVSLDMTPGGDGQTGLILVQSRSYANTENKLVSFSASASVDMTVEQVMGIIRSNKREFYRFTSQGTGCRWWCRTILNDLEKIGAVAPQSTAHFDNYLHFLRCMKLARRVPHI